MKRVGSHWPLMIKHVTEVGLVYFGYTGDVRESRTRQGWNGPYEMR